MPKKMLINAVDREEIRVAVVEDGLLESFYVETASGTQTRGNLYKGVVVNVEPGLEAAFVDYGEARHGFLQMADIRPDLWEYKSDKGKPPPIGQVLKRGMELLVQVSREPTGAKGAGLTTFYSIPGQLMVLTPGHEACGVSRKIAEEAERTRLKDTLNGLKRPEGIGVIARTAAAGRPKREIEQNFRQILRLWEDIAKRAGAAKAPSLIQREEELALRTVRDLFTSEVNEILVDDPDAFERIKRFVGLVSPRRKKVVHLHRESKPIFHKFQLDQQLETIYLPTVSLPSGGSIVINPTEALIAVDVNSHKASGKEIEETALGVNLEAAAEIARQLRLRDLGGLVVVDFIDMKSRKNQTKVRAKLVEELKKDKAKTTVGRISRFGLLEFSRQRIRPPIDFGQMRTCPYCGGRGSLRTLEALSRSVLRTLRRKLGHEFKDGMRVRLAPEMAEFLSNQRRLALSLLEGETGACLDIVADAGLHGEDIRFERLENCWSIAEKPCSALEPAPAPVPPPPPAAAPENAEQAANASDGGEPKKKSSSSRRRRRRSSSRRRTKKNTDKDAEQNNAPPQQTASQSAG
jgi:ribonuclease E